VTKVAHVAELLERGGIQRVESVAEIGCGDGAVLEELARRGIGSTRIGMDISSSAVELARGRAGIAAVEQFDGERIPAADHAYDLVLATHVLEHVPAPAPLLAEIARVARHAILIEVPLERNLSARRPAAQAASEAAGHLHRFDRAHVRRLVAGAGWRVCEELLDPLPLAVHTFGARTAAQRIKGRAKWAVRAALTAVPALGERLITLHYAVLATPP
jgi:SAM-dependent methyltransferase